MFEKRKDAIAEPEMPEATVEEENKVKKPKKRSQEKCENCKRCWGFWDFLRTSWKLFKEFSADTSIHGWWL